MANDNNCPLCGQMTVTLSEQEILVIVAALRFWQISRPDDWLFEIQTKDFLFPSMDNQEISELAERLLPEGPR